MDYQHIGITVLWLFLFGYIIIGAIDFGAGFFAFHAKLTKQDHIINNLISRILRISREINETGSYYQ